MKNYVEEYLDDNGDAYANYFDHLWNTLGYQSPIDLNSCRRLFHTLNATCPVIIPTVNIRFVWVHPPDTY